MFHALRLCPSQLMVTASLFICTDEQRATLPCGPASEWARFQVSPSGLPLPVQHFLYIASGSALPVQKLERHGGVLAGRAALVFVHLVPAQLHHRNQVAVFGFVSAF